MTEKKPKIFFLKNRLLRTEYEFPQKKSCYLKNQTLLIENRNKNYTSRNHLHSTQNSFRDSLQSSQDQACDQSKEQIPSITANSFKKNQYPVNLKRIGILMIHISCFLLFSHFYFRNFSLISPIFPHIFIYIFMMKFHFLSTPKELATSFGCFKSFKRIAAF
jgi:hypothetical protein